MNRVRQPLLLLASVMVGIGCTERLANAHSWYPRLCCNELDCMVAQRVVHNPDGTITMQAGHITVIVPRGFAIDPSQDRDAHVCVYRDINGQYRPRCVFLPAEA